MLKRKHWTHQFILKWATVQMTPWGVFNLYHSYFRNNFDFGWFIMIILHWSKCPKIGQNGKNHNFIISRPLRGRPKTKKNSKIFSCLSRCFLTEWFIKRWVSMNLEFTAYGKVQKWLKRGGKHRYPEFSHRPAAQLNSNFPRLWCYWNFKTKMEVHPLHFNEFPC